MTETAPPPALPNLSDMIAAVRVAHAMREGGDPALLAAADLLERIREAGRNIQAAGPLLEAMQRALGLVEKA